jgi:hypothetical protein
MSRTQSLVDQSFERAQPLYLIDRIHTFIVGIAQRFGKTIAAFPDSEQVFAQTSLTLYLGNVQ